MSGYTPGPWSYYTTPQPNGCPVIGSSKGLMVAMLSHSVNEESQSATAFANARLIAAAPELLSELESVRDWLALLAIASAEDVMQGGPAMFESVSAAIRKATEAAS